MKRTLRSVSVVSVYYGGVGVLRWCRCTTAAVCVWGEGSAKQGVTGCSRARGVSTCGSTYHVLRHLPDARAQRGLRLVSAARVWVGSQTAAAGACVCAAQSQPARWCVCGGRCWDWLHTCVRAHGNPGRWLAGCTGAHRRGRCVSACVRVCRPARTIDRACPVACHLGRCSSPCSHQVSSRLDRCAEERHV
jgi:hypothetical protein